MARNSSARNGLIAILKGSVFIELKIFPWAKSNKKMQGLQGIETIEIAKKSKLTFFHFGTEIRTCHF